MPLFLYLLDDTNEVAKLGNFHELQISFHITPFLIECMAFLMSDVEPQLDEGAIAGKYSTRYANMCLDWYVM
jgi:hypothetical protein